MQSLKHIKRQMRSLSKITHVLISTRSICQNIRKQVYISSSKDIYQNLALEDWLYENADLADTDYLLMWRNNPAIVIGRHQNPWLECNVTEAERKSIAVVRRNSGGGTVFHDEGNLNLSYLMRRSRYNRKKNLEEVVQALVSQWDLNLKVNNRDDILLDGIYKVSGTASKLGGDRTYHHFTLLFDVDKDILCSILQSSLIGVDCKATRSVPSLVKNLKEEAPDISFDNLVCVIGEEFLKEDKEKVLHTVDPTDENKFPGVAKIEHHLKSWEWVYGKTPPFTISRTFVNMFKHVETDAHFSLRINLTINKGRIDKIDCKLSKEYHRQQKIMDLPLRLLQFVNLVGQPVEKQEIERLWEASRQKIMDLQGEEDYAILVWGLNCLVQCIPGISVLPPRSQQSEIGQHILKSKNVTTVA